MTRYRSNLRRPMLGVLVGLVIVVLFSLLQGIAIHQVSLQISPLYVADVSRWDWSIAVQNRSHRPSPSSSSRTRTRSGTTQQYRLVTQSDIMDQHQLYSSNVVSAYNNATFSSPWRKSQALPQWMKDYFQWHQEALHNISNSKSKTWKKFKYVVVRCLERDRRCGGGADRLMSLPLMILLASKLKRLLFYKWEMPAQLEDFLVPPPDGLDWRWPPHPDMSSHKFERLPTMQKGEEIHYHLGYVTPSTTSAQSLFRPHQLQRVASVIYQNHDQGRIAFDALRFNNETEASYNDVFRDCWNSVFIPSPPVQQLIDLRKESLQHHRQQEAEDYGYYAIHVRSQYVRSLHSSALHSMAVNSINCLSQLLVQSAIPWTTHSTVFVSSDGPAAIQATVAYAQQRGLENCVTKHRPPIQGNNNSHTISSKHEPDLPTLHLERGQSFLSSNMMEWTRHNASEYYDTFVDLYLLAQAQCIVYSLGVRDIFVTVGGVHKSFCLLACLLWKHPMQLTAFVLFMFCCVPFF